ncbi:MAG: imidazolonepropionase [Phycisphaerales bacterium]
MPHPVRYIRRARVITLDPQRCAPANPLGVVERADVSIRDGIVESLDDGGQADAGSAPDVMDAEGGVVMPGLVDCHTHLCWAGSRLDEWERKLGGASYLELLAAGGGIMSTVRAVRAASRDELADRTLERLRVALSLGTTTIEIKSGYGLSAEHELKMLRAIGDAASRWPGTVVRTALLGHAIDPEAASPAEFVDRTIDETLAAVHEEFPGMTVDAYCETGAWSARDCVRLFERAREFGHPIRVHADQFNSLGMVREAIRLGAVSVDHLEATGAADWGMIAGSRTAAVILPCCGFHLDNRYARPPNGIPVCIATNANPGSAPCVSMPMALALAVRACGVPIPEAILGATARPARLLGLPDRGVIRPGARADLLLLSTSDERDLMYRFGDASMIRSVVVGGARG